jgi:ParB family chromosome partitioning protein
MNPNPRKSEKPYKAQANLDILFGEENSSGVEVTALKIEQIVLPTSQPRRYFDEDKLNQLAESIKLHGILENLLVRKLKEDSERYELVAGERRYRAAKLAGLTELPVKIKELTDEEAIEISLIENLQREDLNPVEETEAILQLLSSRLSIARREVTSLLYQMLNVKSGKVTNNVISNSQVNSVEGTFQELGIMAWDSYAINRLPLLNLPEDILDAIKEGKIEYTKAKAIAKIKSEEKREEFLNQAIEENLSLSQIKERIEALAANKQDGSPPLATPQKEIVDISQRLKKAQLWKKDPKKWRKAQTLLKKLNELLEDGGEEIGLNDNQE